MREIFIPRVWHDQKFPLIRPWLSPGIAGSYRHCGIFSSSHCLGNRGSQERRGENETGFSEFLSCLGDGCFPAFKGETQLAYKVVVRWLGNIFVCVESVDQLSSSSCLCLCALCCTEDTFKFPSQSWLNGNWNPTDPSRGITVFLRGFSSLVPHSQFSSGLCRRRLVRTLLSTQLCSRSDG